MLIYAETLIVHFGLHTDYRILSNRRLQVAAHKEQDTGHQSCGKEDDDLIHLPIIKKESQIPKLVITPCMLFEE